MIKRLILSTVVLFMVMNVSAQNSKVSTAVFAMDAGELDKAKEAIDIAVEHEKTKTSAKAWYYRGEIYRKILTTQLEKYKDLDSNSLEKAYESYQKALELDTKNKYREKIYVFSIPILHGIFYAKAGEALDKNDYQASYDDYNTCIEIIREIDEYMGTEPRLDTTALFLKAYSAYKLDKNDEALKLFSQLVDMGYKNKYLYEITSDMYIKQEDYDSALKILRKGQEVYPDEKSLVINELNIYIILDKAAEAVEKFEKAIALDPENATLYTALGVVFDQLNEKALAEGDLEKSAEYKKKLIEAYTKAIELNPENPDAEYNLGVTFYNDAVQITKEMEDIPLKEKEKYNQKLNERTEAFMLALPHLENAHKIDPEREDVMRVLSKIYYAMGDYDKYNEIKALMKKE
jgi:tetratricopeptide (TPR) repeat protein